ncbi:MAG TPA: EAL domain-containing protein [Gammaproteobacteria bacterium]|nr:EAL domain-containing protein [Gammaproteobacteria bacterium]
MNGNPRPIENPASETADTKIQAASTQTVLRLLVVEDTPAGAQSLIDPLQAAGLAVTAARIKSPLEFQVALKKQDWDLVLCPARADGFSAKQAIALLQHAKRDIPLILVSDDACREDLMALLHAGARALTAREHPEELVFVVQRELKDLTERRARRHYEKMFRESERRCTALLDTSRNAIACVRKGKVIYANPVFVALTGAAAEPSSPSNIAALIHKDDQAKLIKLLKRVHSGRETTGRETVRVTANGTTFAAEVEALTAHVNDQKCIQLSIPVSAPAAGEEKSRSSAIQDYSTGLYNQAHFLETLEASMNGNAPARPALAYLEVDEFAALAERLGAANADLILRDITTFISPGALATRYGDSTLAILLAGTQTGQAEAEMHALRKAIAAHTFDVNGESVHATCSIGLSLPRDAQGGMEALSWADAACQQAKAEGGNQVIVAQPDAGQCPPGDKKLATRHQLRAAFSEGRFALVYQPIVHLHAQPAETYEVLIRMQGEDGQQKMPADFIPDAEEAGLMPALDRWVIQHAMEALTGHRRQGNETRFLIKISADSLTDQTLVPWIGKQLQSLRLPGDCLIFEIREASAVKDMDASRALITALKQMRCRVALGHFGENTNSLEHLEQLRADFVKFAPSFVNKLTGDQHGEATVKIMVQAAHDLGTLTIATFVQEAAKLTTLWQCNVDYIQGYFLQAPEQELSYDFSDDE